MKVSKIKEFRIKRNLTQKQLGEKCGIAESTIRQYELGLRNPKFETVCKIAKALDVSVDDLIESVSIDLITEDNAKALTYLQEFQGQNHRQIKIDTSIDQKHRDIYNPDSDCMIECRFPHPSEDFYKQPLQAQQGYVTALLNFFEPELVFAYYDVPFDEHGIDFLRNYTIRTIDDKVDENFIEKVREYARFIKSQNN